MPNATLNGVTFTGDVYSSPASVRRAPKTITPKPYKIERLVPGKDGTRNVMRRGQKIDYELEWETVAELTRAAVRAVFDLSTTFTAVLPAGTATYQCEGTDYSEAESVVYPDGTRFYNVKLTIRQP